MRSQEMRTGKRAKTIFHEEMRMKIFIRHEDLSQLSNQREQNSSSPSHPPFTWL